MVKFSKPRKIGNSDTYIIEVDDYDADELKELNKLYNPKELIYDNKIILKALDEASKTLLVGEKEDWELIYREILPSKSIVVMLLKPAQVYGF